MATDGDFQYECWEVDADPVELEGFLGELRKESRMAIIQVFAQKDAPNAEAVRMVAAQTLAASKSGSTLAERPELDLLLRMAGTRQIGEAFRRIGYKGGGKRLFMVAASAGTAAGLKRLRERARRDPRFSPVAGKKPSKGDLKLVERAALLAVRL